MEVYVTLQNKSIGKKVLRSSKRFSNGRNNLKRIIQFNQSVEELICGPHNFKVARKCGIKRGNAVAFVVTEHIFVVTSFCSARDKHKESEDTSEKYVSVKFHSNKNRVGGSRIVLFYF